MTDVGLKGAGPEHEGVDLMSPEGGKAKEDGDGKVGLEPVASGAVEFEETAEGEGIKIPKDVVGTLPPNGSEAAEEVKKEIDAMPDNPAEGATPVVEMEDGEAPASGDGVPGEPAEEPKKKPWWRFGL